MPPPSTPKRKAGETNDPEAIRGGKRPLTQDDLQDILMRASSRVNTLDIAQVFDIKYADAEKVLSMTRKILRKDSGVIAVEDDSAVSHSSPDNGERITFVHEGDSMAYWQLGRTKFNYDNYLEEVYACLTEAFPAYFGGFEQLRGTIGPAKAVAGHPTTRLIPGFDKRRSLMHFIVTGQITRMQKTRALWTEAGDMDYKFKVRQERQPDRSPQKSKDKSGKITRALHMPGFHILNAAFAFSPTSDEHIHTKISHIIKDGVVTARNNPAEQLNIHSFSLAKVWAHIEDNSMGGQREGWLRWSHGDSKYNINSDEALGLALFMMKSLVAAGEMEEKDYHVQYVDGFADTDCDELKYID